MKNIAASNAKQAAAAWWLNFLTSNCALKVQAASRLNTRLRIVFVDDHRTFDQPGDVLISADERMRMFRNQLSFGHRHRA
jgi:hypothetical protein